MQRQCEVCTGLNDSTDEAIDPESNGAEPERTVHMLVEERVVTLCPEHAAKLEAASPQTGQALRALFREAGERRSRVGRRGPLDRRVFPPRPEGRRRSDGRRANDEQV